MPTNCFRFAPRDSVPGLIAKICKYLKDHPGWSEEELEEQIKQFIRQTGVESFNGRTGSVVLNEDDVNNLKIASAYFAEGDETIDELDLVSLYNQGVRFVFTNWNSVTSGYDLAFVLDYFSGSNDVVYYPMATGSGGGGNIVSVNGKTGIVELGLSDILGDSGAQVKLCTATEFTSATLNTWNAYYDSGYRIVGVVNGNATAVDYLYLLKQGEHNHRPIGLTTGSGAVASVNGKTGAVIVGEAGVVEKESDANQYTQIFVDESEDYPPLDAGLLNGKAGKYYLSPRNLLDNSDFTNPVNQRGAAAGDYSWKYAIDRWMFNGTGFAFNGGITIPAGGKIAQRIPSTTHPEINGVTFAVCLANGTIIIDNDGTVALSVGKHPATGLVEVTVHNVSSSPVTVKWAALYEGAYTLETLPPYMPKGYNAELDECQRYFQRHKFAQYETIGLAYQGTEYCFINLPLNRSMRIKNASVNYTGGEITIGNRTYSGFNGASSADASVCVVGQNYATIANPVGPCYCYTLDAVGVCFDISTDL